MTVPKVWRRIPQYYNLRGTVCSKCSSKHFPPRAICKDCGSHEFTEQDFCGVGKVITYTVVRTPISDPEGEIQDIHYFLAPYILAIVELEEGPRLTAEIVDVSPESVKTGMSVERVFRKIVSKGEHGVIQYGYKFRPRYK